MLRRTVICLVLLWVSTCFAFSQTHSVLTIGVEDGLQQSQTHDIVQDDNGYLWFVFASGVTRFDGKEFTDFTKEDGLGSDRCYRIVKDGDGNLWIGTSDNGVTKYDGTNFTIYNADNGFTNEQVFSEYIDNKGMLWLGTRTKIYYYNGDEFVDFSTPNKIKENPIRSIFQDRDGNMLFGSNEQGLLIYDGKTVEQVGEENGLNQRSVFAINQDKKGWIWLGTRKGVNLYNPYDGKIIDLTANTPLSNRIIYDFYVDRKGVVWVGSKNGGIYRYQKGKLEKFDIGDLDHNYSGYGFHQDREGNMWVGTSGIGVVKFSNEKFLSYTTRDGLADNMVFSLVQDQSQRMWVASYGGGVSVIENDTSYTYSREDGLPTNVAIVLMEDHQGRIWAGTSRGVVYFNGNRFVPHPMLSSLKGYKTYDLLQTSDNNIWIAMADMGVARFNEVTGEVTRFTIKDGLLNDRVWALSEDEEGRIWMATNGGVSRFDEDTFVNYTKDDGILSNRVLATLVDKKGNVWFGQNGGVSIFTNDGIKNISTKNGLSSNSTFLLEEDRDGNIWVGTNRGVDKINLDLLYEQDSVHVKSYGKAEGFLGVECNQQASFLDHEGNLWFGTVKGAVKYNPNEDRPNDMEPLTHISGINLFFEPLHKIDSTQRPVETAQQIVFKYNQKHITFNYTAISLTTPEKVLYSYKLENSDDDWSPPTKARSATYSNLDPGSYTFMVKACNSDGIWNETPVVYKTIVITPPFWSTWWFYTMVVVLGVVVVYLFITARTRKLHRTKRALEEQVLERTAELREEKKKLEERNKEIATINEDLNDANATIESRNKDVTDSINYAKRIQRAILPQKEVLQEMVPESFVLFQPKDIVSGDFYWFYNFEDVVVFAAADCTGHGVPGAFMSLICVSAINQFVRDPEIKTPGQALTFVDREVNMALHQQQEQPNTSDGMDIALCAFHPDTLTLEFAGAYRPLYIVRDGELQVIKGDKYAIGGDRKIDKTFTSHEFNLKKGDCVYVFSDGYADQFGGPKGKKLMVKRFKDLLLSISNEPMRKQETLLRNHLTKWMGGLEQVDDICVIGMRV